MKINDYVHVASVVTICGGSTVGECTWIGAGPVVVKDIPDNVVAYGNPCKVIRNNI